MGRAVQAVPESGQRAVVTVAVATLWRGPDVSRPVDERATADRAVDIRSWVAGMSVPQKADLHGRADSQLLLGEPVLVDEVGDGGWSRVAACQQPSSQDSRGYPGWVRTAHLTAADDEDSGPAVVVDATATALRDAPNGDVVLSGVVLGTRLATDGALDRGWVPVRVPGRGEPAWVREADVAIEPAGAPNAKDVLTVADRLVDVPYVWGGLSGYGLDCSGLVHLAHRRLGVTVPRDAHDQCDAATPVPLGQEQPGDLYFFARKGKPVHHVAIVAAAAAGTPDDPRRMLHAGGGSDQAGGKVVAEVMPPDRGDTLIGAGRTLS